MKKIEEWEVNFDLVRAAACTLTSCRGVACEPGADCKHGAGHLLAATQDPNVKQTAQQESRDVEIKGGSSVRVIRATRAETLMGADTGAG